MGFQSGQGLGTRPPTSASGRRPALPVAPLSWSQVGHLPPLLITPAGPRLLQPPRGAAMLGVHSEISFTDARTPIGTADTLVLYTDGVIERRNLDLDAGFHALHQAAAYLATTRPSTSATPWLDRLLPDAARPEEDVRLSDSAPRLLTARWLDQAYRNGPSGLVRTPAPSPSVVRNRIGVSDVSSGS
ncbi:SpoIIE family protein phosphatase [Blastococcus sp. TF02-8]|uniref:SpoIIE family protein phosphatase n=1 Tax=Blastococcus sp. TF02-8 TaxID=2250574 RepID=UPI00141281B7|nr:SpoIIE family protein phosphatase [Blastococcus sp. TF02-8]